MTTAMAKDLYKNLLLTLGKKQKAKKGLGYFEWAKACTWDLFGSNNERGKCVDATVSNVAKHVTIVIGFQRFALI